MPNPWNPREMSGGWSPRPHAGNIFNIARMMGAMGSSQSEISGHLNRVYGGHVDNEGKPYTPQDIGRAAKLGAQWGQRLDNLNNSPGDLIIPRQWIIRNPELANLDAAYRYTVIIKFPGRNGAPDAYRTVIILSDKNLKMSEIRKRAKTTYAEIGEQYRRFRQLPISRATDVIIQLAERRT